MPSFSAPKPSGPRTVLETGPTVTCGRDGGCAPIGGTVPADGTPTDGTRPFDGTRPADGTKPPGNDGEGTATDALATGAGVGGAADRVPPEDEHAPSAAARPTTTAVVAIRPQRTADMWPPTTSRRIDSVRSRMLSAATSHVQHAPRM